MERYIFNRFLRQRLNLKNKLRAKRKNLRASANPFDISNERFVELFRFSKAKCREIIEEVKPYMVNGKNVTRLPKELRFLVALRFFAQGSYQRSVGQDFLLNVSQTIVSRCVREICNIFNTHMLTKYVTFPMNPEDLNMVKLKFYEKHGFPGVIGAIDGNHIKIRKPHKDIEHVYVCRKGGHSINAQVVCDQNLKILDVNARFGGTAHDASVWRASALKVYLDNKYHSIIRMSDRNWWLLGDSGYPQLPFLMTPIQGNNLSSAEDLYNRKHRKARNCIERCFGVLKSRFRCLSGERVLCYDPITAGKIINCCIILHNILIDENTVEVDHEDNDELYNTNGNEEIIEDNTPEGVTIRRRIINDYFNV